jgi:ABC-2 type transport system ATP-binding protein
MSNSSTAAIRTEGLSKDYGSVQALRELDLEVTPGEVLGYLGPNGAGKTTTIRLLLALVRASAGRAEIFGVDCQNDPVAAHRRLAFVPGEVSLWPSLTGVETLHLLGRVRGASTSTTATCSSSDSTSTPRRRCAPIPRATAKNSS